MTVSEMEQVWLWNEITEDEINQQTSTLPEIMAHCIRAKGDKDIYPSHYTLSLNYLYDAAWTVKVVRKV
ncbi:hypothetical protein BDZ91DRAFT_741197 [Kalaharituber pfeilii]|nr:hypothetical protein BDZ91DRAFT_741197 [Kalaharituber pfeilii]